MLYFNFMRTVAIMLSNISKRKEPSNHTLNPYIQILRALAILLVIFFHFGFSFVGRGELGVDIFFVISGYLITTQLNTKKYTLLGFYRNRLLRLFPAYLAITIFFVTLVYILFGSSYTHSLMGILFASNLLQANYYLFNNNINYFSSESFLLPFSHYWSLSVEEQFYLFWPIIVLLSYKISRVKVVLRFLLMLALILTLIIYSIYFSAIHLAKPWYYFETLGRVWELLFGGLLFYLLTLMKSSVLLNNFSKKILLLILLLSSALITLALYSEEINYLVAKILIVFAAMGYIFAAEIRVNKKKKDNNSILGYAWRILVWVGGISYSLYLVHWPIFIILNKIQNGKLDINASIIGILSSICLAFVFKTLVENQFRWSSNKVVVMILLLFWASSTVVLYSSTTSKAPLKANSIELLAASINDASRSTYTPVNIAPGLGELEKEKFIQDGSRVKCPAGVMACTLPTSNLTSSIVLYGDSHAIMWWPALYKAAMLHNYNAYLVAKGGCPPIANLKVANLTNPIDGPGTVLGCNEFWNVSQSNIKKIKPSFIIVAGAERTGNWLEGLGISLEVLKESKAEITFLGDIYYPQDDILGCYAKATDKKVTWFSCGSKVENIDSFEGNREQEKNIALSHGIKYLDIKNLICNINYCPAVTEDVMVYMDKNHISNSYSRVISKSFWELLNIPDGSVS